MLGDGIRRNLATVSKEERDLLVDAIKQLNQVFYPGARTDFPAGGVSYWFKQDEIHQSSHVHGCPAFLPWHRDLLNRFEAMLRSIHPQLSLHYWDWNLDPSNMPDGEGGTINLFDSDFMGNADPTVDPITVFPFGGEVGEPLKSAGFYDPTAANYRDNTSPVSLTRLNPADPTTFSYPDPTVAPHTHYNPVDPPQTLTRAKAAGAPPVGIGAWPSDHDLLTANTWEDFRNLMYGDEQGTDPAHGAHGEAHSYIGGNLGDPHLSFRDPFVFFLHSNIDRLWAMWQRDPAHPERLDPAQVYHTEENSTVMAGREDVEVGEPYWGIQLPLAPWAGFAAQTLMKDVWPVRPWAAPENEQTLPGNDQISTDISLVIPPSYDTAPHSSYVIANQDTFSTSQAAVNLTFSQAIVVIYEGFQPREVGTPTATNPAFTFTIGGAPVPSMSVANPQVLLEDPAGAPDVPQRISITYDVVFADTSAFPAVSGGETAVTMQVVLNYTVGGTTVNATDRTSALLLLVNQPSPYMLDIDPTIPPPGPPNPYWLSTDTRVFNVKQGDSVFGIMQQPNDPLGFIKALVTAFNTAPNDSSHPFLTQLTTDETSPKGLIELTPTSGGTPVFNYAIAKIRYRGNVPASNVSVFFRAFKTMVSALDYDQTGAASVSGNYRRSGNAPGSVPLLGLQSNEIASIPFFAAARVDTSPGGQSMTAQPEDPMNTQISFAGTGSDEVIYCGVWLDVNDTVNKRFPLDPGSDPGGVNGPYQNTRFTIQQLMTGLHYCLVAEIFFWPPGVTTDPIPANATPASSDRLAQRNLSLDTSGNPGWPSTHTVLHTFMVKPSTSLQLQKPGAQNQDVVAAARRAPSIGPDELIIQWGNVPRTTKATLFFPEVLADEILALSALRQHPQVLGKADDHTISIKVADATYIPLPARPAGNLAALMTLTLPAGIRVGQLFKLSVQQSSGIVYPGRAHTMRGAFQFTIPVNTDPEILPAATRNLSVLRYIQQTISPANRWYPIFTRWLTALAAKVAGLGGDPTKVLPSPTGGDVPAPCHVPEPCEVKPRDLWCLNIPWDECDIDGELDLRLRFRKKCK
ncbi:MAG TPA: tyrosinase family protein [Bryobacteraceae bacterium]|nr:tyrosinase family protein [Bryobacteraceae bacterium]